MRQVPWRWRSAPRAGLRAAYAPPRRALVGCSRGDRRAPTQSSLRSAAELGLLVQPGELVRVAHRVDAGDPAVLDDEADRRVELAAEVDPAGDRAVEPHGADHRVGRERREAGEQRRHRRGRRPDAGPRPPRRRRRRPARRRARARPSGPARRRSDRGEEPVDDLLLLGAVDLHPRSPRGHVLARAVRDLPDRRRRLADRLGDLVVRHVEDLAQHEDRALGRRERLQHGQHRDRDALGELDVLGHVGAGEQRLGQPLADVVLAPAGQGAQPVERLAGDDPDQVGARVAHLGVVDVRPPQPGLLDDVLGVGGRAEHLVGDGEEQAAVGDERVVGSCRRRAHGERRQAAGRREPLRLDAERDVAAGGQVRQRDERRSARRARPRRAASSSPADISSVTVGGVWLIASAYSMTSRSSGVKTSDSRQRGTSRALASSSPSLWAMK